MGGGKRGILLDVEGTTTPISFVHKTLFPFADQRLRSFVVAGRAESERPGLKEEYLRDTSPEKPPWDEGSKAVSQESLIAYLHYLMSRDRKSKGLKALQGQIWQEGYQSGHLRGEVYADVPRALRRWREQGRKVAIFSSGSVLAQQTLFGSTLHGNLRQFIDAHFDTHSGPKTDPASYSRIARELEIAPSEIVFISDATSELSAAREAGMEVMLSDRGDAPAASGYSVIRSFDELYP